MKKKLISILLAAAMLAAFAIPAIATGTTPEPSDGTEYDIQITSDIVIDERFHYDSGYYPWEEYGKFDAIVAGKEFKNISLLDEFYGEVNSAYNGNGTVGYYFNDDQEETRWTSGSTHRGSISFYYKSDANNERHIFFTVNVNITVQNIVKSIDWEPITYYEGGFGIRDNYSAVVTYKDGSTEKFRIISLEYPKEIGSYAETGWLKKGYSLKSGSLFEIPVTINVVSSSGGVQITSDIVIDKRIHDSEGKYLWTEYGKFDATVAGKEFKGITVEELKSAVYETYGGEYYSHGSGNQDEKWTVDSKHECEIDFAVRADDQTTPEYLLSIPVNVTVQESIESITAEPITVYEGGYVRTNNHNAVVKYKDGSTENVTLDYRGELPKEIGTYNETAYVYEYVEVSVTINVVSFPADIRITSDITIDEKIYTAGYFSWKEYGKLDAVVAGKELKGITMVEFKQAIRDSYGAFSMGIHYQSSRECELVFYRSMPETDGDRFLYGTYANLKVQETTIESITANPITIYEGGYEIGEGYSAVVTHKDGSTEDAPMFYKDQLPTEIGTYTKTAYVYDCIEVPVTINVVAKPGSEKDEITVENGVATVPDSVVEVAKGENVVIDVTGTAAADNVSDVVIGSDTVDRIADAETSLDIKLPDATVSFDKTAVEAIDKQSGDNTITIVAKEVAENTLNDKQKDALKDKEVYGVITVEAYMGNTRITDFGGGKVTVSVPFELPAGKDSKDFYVAYVADDGTVTAMPTTYADGKLSFTTTHFSNYVVLENKAAAPETTATPETTSTPETTATPETTQTDSPVTGDNGCIMMLALLAVACTAAVAVCAAKKRRDI